MTDATSTESWFAADVATFGDRLAAAREAAGLGQEDLARRLGVRLTTISDWEDDRSDPRANRLAMVAGMLNVSLRWLLTGEGDGLEAPFAGTTLSDSVQTALDDMARMRVQMLALGNDMGQMEKRLRHLLRAQT